MFSEVKFLFDDKISRYLEFNSPLQNLPSFLFWIKLACSPHCESVQFGRSSKMRSSCKKVRARSYISLGESSESDK